MMVSILEFRAKEKDREVHNRLLKELVFRYSAAERELMELNQLKNKFLGIAAHDLRNPLVSIRGFAELLLNGDLGPVEDDQKEFLALIHSASQDMLRLVNDLLDVSVIESGRLSMQIQEADLKSLLENRLKIIQVTADAKNIAIRASLDPVPSCRIDTNRIGQVVDNLIGNALKFSPAGSEITVGLQEVGGRLRVSVADQGPGLTPEDQAKLFGDFQRLSAQPTGGEKSTGLGLAIVKKIVEAHGGRVEVQGEPGRGSTFSFEIPLENVHA